jgi:peroxiredoxin
MTERSERLAVGDVLPNVQLPDLEGRALRIGDFRGRQLLIFMWASW